MRIIPWNRICIKRYGQKIVARSLESIESEALNDLELCNGRVSVKELGDTGIFKMSYGLTSTNSYFDTPPIGPEKGGYLEMAKFISEEVHSPIDSCRHLYDTEVRFFRPLLEEKKGIGQI